MPIRSDLERELDNLASAHPLARLEAIHEVGVILRTELDTALDAAELAQVRTARKWNPKASWNQVGDALGISHVHARRRFHDRIQ